MELRQLRYFAAVFEERSISRAAERLLISQPALTRQIRLLERLVGTSLFDRVPTGVRPTASGAALHTHALAVLRMADASGDVARSAGPVGEQVELGLPPGVPVAWLRGALDRVRTHVPEALLGLADVGSAEQLRLVRAGRLDIVLVHLVPPDTLTNHLLFEQPFGVAVRPDHPLAARSSCPVRALHGVAVLAHAREQVPTEHDRLIAATHQVGSLPRWRFARFTENALVCAEIAGADAVLLTEPSALRLLPDWPWRRLVEPEVSLPTWVARQPLTRGVVAAVHDALVEAAAGSVDPNG